MVSNLEWLFKIEKTKNIKYKGKPKQGTVSGFGDIGGTNTEKRLQLF